MRKLLSILFAFVTVSVMAQTGVSGTVLDDQGEPLIGVSILIEGTTTGTVTDFEGNYSLIAGDKATLVFSYLGYRTERIAVNGRSVINR